MITSHKIRNMLGLQFYKQFTAKDGLRKYMGNIIFYDLGEFVLSRLIVLNPLFAPGLSEK